MAIIRVGVLRGGPSDEYDVSLATGKTVLASLLHDKFRDKYHVHDILLSKDGVWYHSGVPIAVERALAQVDVVVNALHGAYGEDGKVQMLLEAHGVPFTGSKAFASAVAMNKVLTKDSFVRYGIKTPRHILIDSASLADGSLLEKIDTIFRTFSLPVVVKPSESGSSVGISIARAHGDLAPHILKAFQYSVRRDGTVAPVMVEEFIAGTEATVGIIDNFRGEELYALPVVEIRHNRDFFDYESKYSRDDVVDHRGKKVAAEEIVPSHFSSEIKAELERLARDIHRVLGLRHYSRSDFIVAPRRGIYALEVNTLPGLTETSLVPKALAAVGASLPDFFDHIVTLAIEGK